MNKKQILLLSAFILILVLIIFTQNTRNFYEGQISKVKTSQTITTINLENNEIEFMSFDKIKNLENCKKVKIYGKEEIYQNKKQIIVDKLICLK